MLPFFVSFNNFQGRYILPRLLMFKDKLVIKFTPRSDRLSKSLLSYRPSRDERTDKVICRGRFEPKNSTLNLTTGEDDSGIVL